MKRVLLFSLCGEETYGKVRDLLHPQVPPGVSYDDVMQRRSRHFESGPSELLGRWRFHKRDQESHETIPEYVDALRAHAKDCHFSTTTVTTVAPATTTAQAPSGSITQQSASGAGSTMQKRRWNS
ncbi:uncharacterized protein ISCGN_017546 [Ixodes scapularis]